MSSSAKVRTFRTIGAYRRAYYGVAGTDEGETDEAEREAASKEILQSILAGDGDAGTARKPTVQLRSERL